MVDQIGNLLVASCVIGEAGGCGGIVDALDGDVRSAEFGGECFGQRGTNDRTHIAGLAGAASEDQSDGLAGAVDEVIAG